MATILPLKVLADGSISQFVAGDMLPSNIIPGGAGSGPVVGTAVVDFGNAPGTNIATVIITGQTSITSSSLIAVNIRPVSTATHNILEHQMAPIRLSASDIVNGTGFTIYAISEWRLTGTFNVQWSYQ